MASVTFVPSRIAAGDFVDVPTPGSGDNGKALTYNHGTGLFVYTGFEASGAVSTHVGLANPHSQYLLASNYTAADVLAKLLTVDGSGSGLDADLLDGNSSAAFATAGHSHSAPGSTTQVIYNSAGSLAGDAGMTYDATNDALTVSGRVIVPVIRPASDSATAIQLQNVSGTAVITIDTTNNRIGLGTTPGALFDALSPSASLIAFRIKAASGQSADLIDIRDNSNSQRVRVAYDGTCVFASNVSGTQFAAGSNQLSSFGATIGSGSEIDFVNSSTKVYMAASGKIASWARTAVTAAINDTFIIAHNSSGTPASGLGVGLLARIETSTNEDTDAGRLSWQWATVTHASRASKGQLSAYYTTTERPCITWGADSSVALLSFYDVTTPIARQVLATGASRTVDDVITALQNLGLVKQS